MPYNFMQMRSKASMLTTDERERDVSDCFVIQRVVFRSLGRASEKLPEHEKELKKKQHGDL